MNERIKQLLLDSGFKIFGDKIVAGDFGSSGNATLCSQKLAKLIVRNCADICYNREYANGSAYGDAIMKDFGVEE